MVEESKSVVFEETGENDNFSHLLASDVSNDKPKVNIAFQEAQKPPPPVPGTLQKQYSNLYEGQSNDFEGLLERFEDDEVEIADDLQPRDDVKSPSQS